jgi:ribosomal protein L37AE/L43A
MQKVVRLDDYRKPGAPRARAAAERAPHYFCQRCDADRFRLYASGAVHCADCGALIRNVEVSAAPTSRGADQ